MFDFFGIKPLMENSNSPYRCFSCYFNARDETSGIDLDISVSATDVANTIHSSDV